jgi:hypothetical protein
LRFTQEKRKKIFEFATLAQGLFARHFYVRKDYVIIDVHNLDHALGQDLFSMKQL